MQSTSLLTHEEAVARARTLATAVGERAVAAEAARRQLPETIDEIRASGLVGLLVPRRWGGSGLPFDTLVDAVIEIAKADASAGWCCAFFMVHGWLLARFPAEAQQEVWAQNQDALLAVSIIPAGRPTPVEGGYRFSGSWNFVSGIDHCDWAMLMGKVPRAGGTAELRFFLVPGSDYQVRDTWFPTGLAASGSNTVVIQEAFVPAHRTVAFADLRTHGQAPGARLNTEALYQLSVPGAFPLPLVAAIVGSTWGAYDTWKGQLRKVVTTITGERPAEMSHVQIRVADVFQSLTEAEYGLRHVLDAVRLGRPFAEQERLALRLDYASIARRCRQASQVMLEQSGGHAHFTSSPIRRYVADIAAMTAHTRLNSDTAAEGYGRFELGVGAKAQDPYGS